MPAIESLYKSITYKPILYKCTVNKVLLCNLG